VVPKTVIYLRGEIKKRGVWQPKRVQFQGKKDKEARDREIRRVRVLEVGGLSHDQLSGSRRGDITVGAKRLTTLINSRLSRV